MKDINIKIQELISIGKETKGNIIKEYMKRKSFSDSEYPEGIITICAGGVSLLLIVNGFKEIFFEENEKEIIQNIFSKICHHIDNFGYDATPFLRYERTEKYFAKGRDYYYLDTVSWILSFMIHLRFAHRNGKLKVKDSDMTKVKKIIKENLELISNGSIETGGWGFANGCKKPNLFYSYAISESLGDFADYIKGEFEEIDREMIEFISEESKDLIERIDELRKATSRWLIDTYLDSLGNVLINPEDPLGERFSEKEDGELFILLYYTYFVIDMLIINSADVFFPDEKEKIIKSIEHGIYLSRIIFDKAKDSGEVWWDNKKSSLELKLIEHEVIPSQIIGNQRIVEPGLVPLCLRCNTLYVFYISEGLDNKIDELFQLVLDTRDINESGLWDNIDYNLMVTERAIEAIIDYADYLRKFQSELPIEQKRSKPSQDEEFYNISVDSIIRTFISDSVKEYFNSSVAKDNLSKSYQNEFNKNFLESLTTALAESEQLILGKKLTTGINEKSFFRFIKQCGNFLLMLLFYNMKDKRINDSEYKIILNRLKKQSFFKSLAMELKREDTEIDIGEIFTTVVTKFLKEGK